LTLISIATVYTVQQIPERQTSTNIVGTYISTAAYDYTAQLIQSTIYDNRTSLKPNEGVLYTRLVKQIDLTLTYAFDATFPTATTIQYNVTRTLKTQKWEYQLPSASSPETTDLKTILVKIPSYSNDEMEPLVSRINKETGAFDSFYTLEVKPTFIITGTSPLGPIHETFEPTLRISTNNTKQGYVTTIDDLNQTQAGQLTQTQTTINPNVLSQRYASYALAVVSLTGLSISSWLYVKNREKTPKRLIEKQIEAHKDIIIEAADGDKIANRPTIVNLKTMDELVKASEILAKPIIHMTDKENKNVFYVVDNTTKYQYNEDLT
jgi:hypothetical protein